MLKPDDLPAPISAKARVIHSYPEGWSDHEVDAHRYDDCPCSPVMTQIFSDPDGCCPQHSRVTYTWRVYHRRIPGTEEKTT